MKWLITADLHLSSRPKDAYRFGIFKWLATQQAVHGVDATFILGDICDQKDRHGADLVNTLIDELIGLKPPVFILKGNHDYTDPANPFFRFLNCIEGAQFIIEPTVLPNLGVVLIPHQRSQSEFDKACGCIPTGAHGVMCHQTFQGAKAETGARLNGLQAPLVSLAKPKGVWAGDVHRPQVVNCGALVTYAGAPYHIRHSDDYVPRVLLIRDSQEQNLYFPAPRKWTLTVRDASDIENHPDLQADDQVKLVIELAREEAVEWQAVKRQVLGACKAAGLAVYGVDVKIAKHRPRARLHQAQAKTYEEVLDAFCAHEGVAGNIKQAGLGLVHE